MGKLDDIKKPIQYAVAPGKFVTIHVYNDEDIKALMLDLINESEEYLQVNPACQGCMTANGSRVELRQRVEDL